MWKFARLRVFLALFCVSLTVTVYALPTVAFDFGEVLRRSLPTAIEVLQLYSISDRDEVLLAQAIDRKLKRGEVRISNNRRAQELVNQLGQFLAKHSDRPDIPYTFQVVEDRNLNAFATMGGFVYINTGTIAAADNIAQLAGVIAHEIGHIAGKHSLEQIRQIAIARGLATVAGIQDEQLVNMAIELVLRLPRSRDNEFDADRRAVLNLARAGIAPQGIVGFMQKLERIDDGRIPVFLRTHPPTGERIQAINQVIRDNNLSGTGGLNDREYQQAWRGL